MRQSESGNVFFYIFLCIGLLAALSFAIAQGGRITGSALQQDNASVAAAEIIAYGDTVAKAVTQLRLRGVAETGLSFEDPALSAGYANVACTTGRCKIFNPSGGAVVYKAPDSGWLDTSQSASTGYGEYFFTGIECIPFIGSGGASPSCTGDGIDNEELIMFLPYIKKDICIQINEKLGMTNPSGDPPFTGGFGNGVALGGNLGATSSYINGHMAGCFEGDTTPPAGTYHYFQVLLAR